MSAQGYDFIDATAPGEEWVVVPLRVHHGHLALEPRRGLGVDGYETFGSSIAFLYALEQRGNGNLDATIACIARHCTLIARIVVEGARISVEESPDAFEWKHKLAQTKWY